jgi:arylsulfatase A-like enzyme
MPHFPYFFDAQGNPYPDDLIYGDSMIVHKERFINYIRYTDRKIAELLDTLFQQKTGRNLFILQSDHGLADLDKSRTKDAFRNYSAFFFPDGNYDHLYRGMSNVNTFRIILNKYFGYQLSLLKDSSSFIK